MTKALKLAVLGSLILVLAVGLWRWRDAVQARRQAHREAWIGYLRGPLSDLLEGSTRGRELLALSGRRALKKAERAELERSALLVQGAESRLRLVLLEWGQDGLRPLIENLVVPHAELAELSRVWVKVAHRKDLIPDALVAEEGFRRNLGARLDALREQAPPALRLNRDEVLEMNALVYSLKE